MKTARFKNKDLVNDRYVKVAITVGMPKFKLQYELAGRIKSLAPWSLMKVNDRQEFTRKYFEILDRIGVTRILAEIKKYESNGKEIVLLCYEDVSGGRNWCHRLVFAEWWLQKTGEVVEELPEPPEEVTEVDTGGVTESTEKTATAKEPTPGSVQKRLF